jgi:predicted SnoaL-like aldol condensation-catalyzing enzyme
VHTHVATPQGDLATVDLFRVDSGKIVEHWDVVQPVPDEVLNPHGMF